MNGHSSLIGSTAKSKRNQNCYTYTQVLNLESRMEEVPRKERR
jgi:hypothetical protein